MNELYEYFQSHQERFIAEWKEFLRFKSISANPAYRDDSRACARWVANQLERLGCVVDLLPAEESGNPCVYGVLRGDPSKPTVLFYGHYDVQPVDPLAQWESDPFEPVLRGDRLYARGAQDNKGQLFAVCKAIEALRATGRTLPTIKVLIEGAEECGSKGTPSALEQYRTRVGADTFAADLLMVCDTGMVELGVPTITMGLRGIAHCEVVVHGPSTDLHSGMYGGVVLNPLQALVSIIASLHCPDGSVAVPGFYDGVSEPTPEQSAAMRAASIDLAALSATLGVALTGGEARFHPLERRGVRPTVEVNGIGGGYQGEGGKTVIPTCGMAKLSLRLVAGQDPQRVMRLLEEHLHRVTPAGVRLELRDVGIGGAALQLPTDSAVLQSAKAALSAAFGREPVLVWEGASVPIIPVLAQMAGAQPLLVGFGLDEDRIHAPNESFSLQQFEQVYRYATTFLAML
jgi:acetylornithine deacetylase/succinyl-diaminopimelate desuccinylase-like protein